MSNTAAPPRALSRDASRFVGQTCLCLHAQRAARALARRFDAVLRPVNLTNGQFSIMMALNRPEPRPIGEVAEILAMDRTTVTAKLKPLIRRGLVEVRTDDADRRSRGAALTPTGRALLAEAFPLWQRGHDALEREIAAGDAAFDAARLRSGLRALS